MVVFKMALESSEDDQVLSQSDHSAQGGEEGLTSKARYRRRHFRHAELEVTSCDAYW